jgi:hypothetical protein
VLAVIRQPYLVVIPTGAGAVTRIERPGLTLDHARWIGDGRQALVRARDGAGRWRLYRLTVDGTDVAAITPEALSIADMGWRPSPDGRAVAVATSTGPRIFSVAAPGGDGVAVPGAAVNATPVGWIDRGLLLSDDPMVTAPITLVNPQTGASEPWLDIQPSDPAGLMSLDLYTFVVTPDGRGYGYTWHRATSDLFVVRGWR